MHACKACSGETSRAHLRSSPLRTGRCGSVDSNAEPAKLPCWRPISCQTIFSLPGSPSDLRRAGSRGERRSQRRVEHAARMEEASEMGSRRVR